MKQRARSPRVGSCPRTISDDVRSSDRIVENSDRSSRVGCSSDNVRVAEASSRVAPKSFRSVSSLMEFHHGEESKEEGQEEGWQEDREEEEGLNPFVRPLIAAAHRGSARSAKVSLLSSVCPPRASLPHRGESPGRPDRHPRRNQARQKRPTQFKPRLWPV